jgi:uncharacterized protein with HEPN domain
MRDDQYRLVDILEAINNIGVYAVKGKATFDSDELIQVWIIHHLEIIGEAASQLSTAFLNNHPVLPWAQIIAMRNILVHEYFGIDLNEVWKTVEEDLPHLKQEIEKLISQ